MLSHAAAGRGVGEWAEKTGGSGVPPPHPPPYLMSIRARTRRPRARLARLALQAAPRRGLEVDRPASCVFGAPRFRAAGPGLEGLLAPLQRQPLAPDPPPSVVRERDRRQGVGGSVFPRRPALLP